ncbi:MAG: class I SAM-dependent methyltransferase [Caulobacteraceae bacterium]
MPFEDDSFDFVFANHVLEHVGDDRRAVGEIRRVLRVGGRAILQTPFSRKLDRTWEDGGIDTDSARLQAYGQEDHVRLFGRDIFERIGAAGLASAVREHGDLLAAFAADEWGVNPAEPFFLFRRET